MISNLSPTLKGILFAIMGYSGFAISDASAKFLTDSYETFHIIAFISAFCCLFLLLLAPKLGGFQRIGPGKAKFHLLRIVMNFCLSFSAVVAFAHLPLTTIYAIIFAMPFIASLMSIPLYHERLSRRKLSIILVGFLGVLVAMRPSPESFNLYMLLPLAAAFFASIMWISAKSLGGESTFNMSILPFFGNGLICLAIILATQGGVTLPALSDVPYFMICGVGVSMGVVGLSVAYSTAPTATVSPFNYVQIIWGLLFGFFIFGDIPDAYTMVGAAIIISSGLYLIFSEARSQNCHPSA